MKTLVVALLAACAATSGWAGLGSSLSNLGPRARSMGTQQVSTGLASYTQVQRKLDSGTEVHEYLDASGKVFAVSWSGPFLPDLKEILGVHFDTMVAQAGKRPAGARSPLVVKQDDVVVISDGHMGAFDGKAWLPRQLPAGFNPEDIK
jgi:Protein of unknown function (DUF2844)